MVLPGGGELVRLVLSREENICIRGTPSPVLLKEEVSVSVHFKLLEISVASDTAAENSQDGARA